MLRDPSRHSDDLSNNQSARDRQRERERQERAQMLPSDDKDISASAQDLFHAPVKVKPSVEDQTSIEVRKSLGNFERVRQYMLDNGSLSRRLIGVDLNTGSGSVVSATTGQASSVGSSDSNRSTSAPHPNTSPFIKPASTFPSLHRNTSSSTNSVPTASTSTGAQHQHNNFRPITTNSISVQSQKVQLSQSQPHPSSSAPSSVNHSSQANNYPSSNCSISSFSVSSGGGGSALSATGPPPSALQSNTVKKHPPATFSSSHPTFHLTNNTPSSLVSTTISETGDPLLSSASIHIPKIVRPNNNNLPTHAISTTNSTFPTTNIPISNPKITTPIKTNNTTTINPNTTTLQISAAIEELPNTLPGASTEKKLESVTFKKPGPLERTESQVDLDNMLREMMDIKTPLAAITTTPVKETPPKKVAQRRSSKGDEKPVVDVIEGLSKMKNVPSPVSSKGMDSSSSASGDSSSSESDSDSDSSSHSPGSTERAKLPIPTVANTSSPSRSWGLLSFVGGLKNDNLNNSITSKGPSDLTSNSPKNLKDNQSTREPELPSESRVLSKTESPLASSPLSKFNTSTLSSPSPEKALSKPTTPVKSTSSVTTRSSNAEQNQNNSKVPSKSPRRAPEVKKEAPVASKPAPLPPPPVVVPMKGISAVIMKAKGPSLSSSENEDEEPVVVKEPITKTKPAAKRPTSAGKTRRKSSTSSCDRLQHKSDDDSSPETKGKKKPVQDRKKSEMIGSIFRFNNKDKVDSPNGESEKGGKGGSSATTNSSAASTAKGKGKGSKSKPVVVKAPTPPPPLPPPPPVTNRVSAKDSARKSASSSAVIPPSKTNGEVEASPASKAKGVKSTPGGKGSKKSSSPKSAKDKSSSSSKETSKSSSEKAKSSDKGKSKTTDKVKASEKAKSSDKASTSDKGKSGEKEKAKKSDKEKSTTTSSSTKSKSPKVNAKVIETAKTSTSTKASTSTASTSKPDPPASSGSGKGKGKKRDVETMLGHPEPVKTSNKKPPKPIPEDSSQSSTAKAGSSNSAPITAVPNSKEEPLPLKLESLLCKIPLKLLTKVPSKAAPKVEVELEKKPLSSPVHTATEKVILTLCDDQDWYLKEAKRLKHKADKEVSGLTAQTGTYLEAGLYFILTGITMERTVGAREAFTMYKDTLSLIRYIGSRYRNRDEDMVEAKLMVLSLRCQSMLSLRLYQLKHAETKEAAKYLTDYFSKTPAAEITAIHPPMANSPQLNTPSPHSPTPTLSPSTMSVFHGHHLPSPLHASTIHQNVSINRVVYSKMFKQCTHTANLMSAHELWDSADQLIGKYHIADFFIPMNGLYGPLSLHSTLVDLVLYVKHGLKIMKDASELT